MGHYMRCQVLAEEIAVRGGRIAAVVYRGDSGTDWKPLIGQGEAVLSVPPGATPEEDAAQVVQSLQTAGADRLILDSYVVNEAYQSILRAAGVRWLQFDSHARQGLWADWVLNASPGATEPLYKPLRRRRETRFLLGPRHAVLRKAFREAHGRALIRNSVRRVFLCLGGGDDGGATLQVLKWLAPLLPEWVGLEAVVGHANRHRGPIRDLLAAGPMGGKVHLHAGASAVQELMLDSDLGILSGGVLSHEACAVGLPMLLISMADNQEMNCSGWAGMGAGFFLGRMEELNPSRLLEACGALMQDPPRVAGMSGACLAAADGCGAARVADVLQAGAEWD